MLVALLFPACGSGGAGAGKAGATVDIAEFTFKPGTVTVPTGTPVTWTNRDGFAHLVKPEGTAFPASASLGQGQSYTYRFTHAGTYPYICGIHNSMTGTVVVR